MPANQTLEKIVKKKSTPKIKKTAKRKPIKYEDKSAGQGKLVIIFDAIKKLMKPYEKGSIKARGEKAGIYNLINAKAIEFDGRKKDEIYFATILIQKGYVGFYYMPIYANKKLGEIIKPELMKCLKGKACFHIKKNDEILLHQIEHALEVGYDDYKKRGWSD
jgi:hypothetical protein